MALVTNDTEMVNNNFFQALPEESLNKKDENKAHSGDTKTYPLPQKIIFRY